MARYAKTEAAPSSPVRPARPAGTAEIEGTRADPAFQGLPGVVNDLPEVAPHEWIYLMS